MQLDHWGRGSRAGSDSSGLGWSLSADQLPGLPVLLTEPPLGAARIQVNASHPGPAPGPSTVSSQTGGQGTVPEADEQRCRDEAEKVAKSQISELVPTTQRAPGWVLGEQK